MGKNNDWLVEKAKVSSFTQNGVSMDEGIVDLVTGLRLLGLPTVESCEGHPDKTHLMGYGSPYISFRGSDIVERKVIELLDEFEFFYGEKYVLALNYMWNVTAIILSCEGSWDQHKLPRNERIARAHQARSVFHGFTQFVKEKYLNS